MVRRLLSLFLLALVLSACGGSSTGTTDSDGGGTGGGEALDGGGTSDGGGSTGGGDDGGSTGGGSTGGGDDGGSTGGGDGGGSTGGGDGGGSTGGGDGGSTGGGDGGSTGGGDGGALARGAGFATTFTRFAVPPSGLGDGFFAAAYTYGARGWLVVDLDGDGRPDLVQTSDSADSAGRVWSDAQGAYWKVFRGNGAGFATTYTRFSVPPSGLSDGFFSAYYGYDARHWLLVDLDGDGRPDLVQTADPARAGGFVFTDASGPYWKVWPGGTGGFAATPKRWAVPQSGLSDGFFSAYYTDDVRGWSLVDLDGDGRPDLVQTSNPALSGGFVFTDATGAYWKVWAGSTGGFASTHKRWALPPSGLSDGFFAGNYTSPGGGQRFWSLMDLTGDRRPDLVHTADPSRAGGFVWSDAAGPHWKVYPAIAEGFGPATRVSVGASGLDDGFFATAYTSAPSLNGQRFWMTLDLDGDGRPELVQTADPAHAGGFVFSDSQGAYWKVWRPGSAAAPVRWPVPPSGLSDGFFAAYWTDGANGLRAWLLRDLDGDGRLDLVQTADPTREGLYVFSDAQGAYWKVYKGL